MKLTLIDKRKETKDIVTFIFKPEKKLKWKAGQYLIYTINHNNPDNRGKMRFFTISAAPFEKHPSITTRINNSSSSTFKKALTTLKIGDVISAKGPDGDFVIENLNKEYIFIVKGVGISPFMSILKELNHKKSRINGLFLYINKTSDFPFKKELSSMHKNQPKLEIKHLKSLDEAKKYITKNLKKDIHKFDFYVSGASIMTLETEKFLDKLRVAKDKQKLDYFSGYKDN